MFQYNEVHVHVFFASANFRKFVDAKKEAYVHPSIVFLYCSVRTHRILTVQCRLVPENGYGTKQYRSNELFVPVPSIQYNTVHYTVSFTVGKSILKNIPITKKNSKIPEFYDFTVHNVRWYNVLFFILDLSLFISLQPTQITSSQHFKSEELLNSSNFDENHFQQFFTILKGTTKLCL